METPNPAVGPAFVEALLAKDWIRLAPLLDDDIDFRGLTPGRAWEANSVVSLIETVFTQWFEPTDDIYETINVTTDHVAERQRVTYRFRVRNPQDDYVCEQTAYYNESDGKISNLRVLCSGFIPSS